MEAFSEKTIIVFAKRSNLVVIAITLLFALAGSLVTIFTNGWGIWGLWIPLCFLTIPPIHYLCRKVHELASRVAELENKIKRL